MPRKCHKSRKCRKSRRCPDPCENYFYCQRYCPCPTPTPVPPQLTNIAVTGLGPFGIAAQIAFTVTNTTVVAAENVILNITVPLTSGAIQTGAVVTAGNIFPNPLPNNAPNILWSVGTLLGGQSATITINQVNGLVQTVWTAQGSTSTPETTLANNNAFVVVPIPQ